MRDGRETDELVVTFLSEMDALGVRDRLAPCGFDPTDLRAVEHVAGRWSEHEYVGKVRAMLGCSDREAARGCTTQNARRLWFP